MWRAGRQYLGELSSIGMSACKFSARVNGELRSRSREIVSAIGRRFLN